jgi:hypothetical protein
MCGPVSSNKVKWTGTLPKIVEEIVSGVLVDFEFFHFMWALLMEVVSMS